MTFVRIALSSLALLTAVTVPLAAATLPPHAPLRILIVSDEVNPHGLPPEQLTQPGDLSAAILSAGSGLSIDPLDESVLEIPTNQIEEATSRLLRARTDPTAYDVLIYFAHRIPNAGGNEVARQDAFTAAVQGFLEGGGGVVAFHHGSYLSAGKEGILDLIGATASGSVPWNTLQGQNVIAVAPRHFVASQGLSYPSTIAYSDPGRGIAAGTYPFFNNTPDERYPSFEKNGTAETFRVLFGSDYVEGGSTHLLGFTHRRAGWKGVVVGYQPGEYQPIILDVTGRNFQILANAIVWSANAFEKGFRPVTPCRVIDTRLTASPLAADATLVIGLTGTCGVPASARAVAVNLTVTQPSAAGGLTLYPADLPAAPETSAISYGAGKTRANNAVIGVSDLGELAVRSRQPAGNVHLVLDVSGYFQ